MFDKVTVHGAAGPPGTAVPAILWGYHQAAVLKTWVVKRGKRDPKTGHYGWTLQARSERHEAFMLRQGNLAFTAPRPQNGFWRWPIVGEVQCVGNELRATLGQPEF